MAIKACNIALVDSSRNPPHFSISVSQIPDPKTTNSNRKALLITIYYKTSQLLPYGLFAGVTLDLEVLQDYNSTRQDNKELTEEEATRIAENMTPEQRERLRQRVKDRLSGGSGTSTEAPDSSEAPDSTEAPE